MTVKVTPGLLRSWPLPALPSESDKETRGRVLIVGGGPETPGAAVLAGLGALRAGAGKLQMAAAEPWAGNLTLAIPEARVVAVAATDRAEISAAASDRLIELGGEADAIVLGPGMVDEEIAAGLALAMTPACGGAAFVLDAGALTGMASVLDRVRAPVGGLVLTPHAGEMAKTMGWTKDDVLADPRAVAERLANRLGAVVVMKGVATHVVVPGGKCWTHEQGVAGLGTSGSGDVLAGVIGGLLARGAPPAQAAVWGVALHGAAGAALTERIGPLGFLAREILPEIPRALARLAG